MSSTLRAFFIVGAYIEEAKQMISHLQSLDYASYSAGKEIREQTLNPAPLMNPWEEVNQCTTNLRNCIRNLTLDIEAHKDIIRKQNIVDKVVDLVKDVDHALRSRMNVVVFGADVRAEARKMADMTHTGRGKFNYVMGLGGGSKTDDDYENLVERDEKLIKKVERLIRKYDPKE